LERTDILVEKNIIIIMAPTTTAPEAAGIAQHVQPQSPPLTNGTAHVQGITSNSSKPT